RVNFGHPKRDCRASSYVIVLLELPRFGGSPACLPGRTGSQKIVNVEKKAAISCASSLGSSRAAKCPPRGMTVHRRTLYSRSTHSRGGTASRTYSLAKTAIAVGTPTKS